MAITFVGSAVNDSGTASNGSATVTMPTVSAGDIALVHVITNSNGQTHSFDWGTWTEIDTALQNATVVNSSVFWAEMDGTEGGTDLTDTLGSGSRWVMSVMVFSGVNTTTPIATSATDQRTATSAITTISYPAVTPTADDQAVVAFGCARVRTSGESTSYTAGTNYTEATDGSTSSTSFNMSAHGVYRLLSGQNGVSQTPSDSTSTNDLQRQNMNTIALAVAAGGSGAEFTTTVGTATAAGGSSTFTGGGTLTSVEGAATASGGSSAFTGGAALATVVGEATASGGSSTFTGGAEFSTVVGTATAEGGSSTFAGGAEISTVVGVATASGGSSDFSVTADFSTVVGEAVAAGGSSTFTGGANLTTTEGAATAAGGSSTFTVSAELATVEGAATASGGSSTFTGGADFTTLEGAATASGGSSTFTGGAVFVTTVGAATASGGSSTFSSGDVTLLFEEDFEGTPGAAMSSSNTGWDIFNGSGTRTLESTPTPMFGSTLGEYNGGQALTKDSTSLPGTVNGGTALTQLYFRGYYYLDSATSLTLSRMIVFESSVPTAGTDIAVVRMNANGTLRMMDGTSAVGSATTHALSTDPTRIEYFINQDTNEQTIRMWWGADLQSTDTGATNFEEQTAALTTNTDIEVFGTGFYASQATNHSLYVEEVAVGYGNWIGPAVSGGTFDTTAGSATASGGSSTFTGGADFVTLAGEAVASGGSSTFSAGSELTTLVGEAIASGGLSDFAGGAELVTLEGAATASGGVSTFDVEANLITLAGEAVASGGSSTFDFVSGDAEMSTTVGAALAAGGVTVFDNGLGSGATTTVIRQVERRVPHLSVFHGPRGPLSKEKR